MAEVLRLLPDPLRELEQTVSACDRSVRSLRARFENMPPVMRVGATDQIEQMLQRALDQLAVVRRHAAAA